MSKAVKAGTQVFFFWKRVETSLARPVTSPGRIHLVEAEVPRFLRVSNSISRDTAS